MRGWFNRKGQQQQQQKQGVDSGPGGFGAVDDLAGGGTKSRQQPASATRDPRSLQSVLGKDGKGKKNTDNDSFSSGSEISVDTADFMTGDDDRSMADESAAMSFIDQYRLEMGDDDEDDDDDDTMGDPKQGSGKASAAKQIANDFLADFLDDDDDNNNDQEQGSGDDDESDNEQSKPAPITSPLVSQQQNEQHPDFSDHHSVSEDDDGSIEEFHPDNNESDGDGDDDESYKQDHDEPDPPDDNVVNDKHYSEHHHDDDDDDDNVQDEESQYSGSYDSNHDEPDLPDDEPEAENDSQHYDDQDDEGQASASYESDHEELDRPDDNPEMENDLEHHGEDEFDRQAQLVPNDPIGEEDQRDENVSLQQEDYEGTFDNGPTSDDKANGMDWGGRDADDTGDQAWGQDDLGSDEFAQTSTNAVDNDQAGDKFDSSFPTIDFPSDPLVSGVDDDLSGEFDEGWAEPDQGPSESSANHLNNGSQSSYSDEEPIPEGEFSDEEEAEEEYSDEDDSVPEEEYSEDASGAEEFDPSDNINEEEEEELVQPNNATDLDQGESSSEEDEPVPEEEYSDEESEAYESESQAESYSIDAGSDETEADEETIPLSPQPTKQDASEIVEDEEEDYEIQVEFGDDEGANGSSRRDRGDIDEGSHTHAGQLDEKGVTLPNDNTLSSPREDTKDNRSQEEKGHCDDEDEEQSNYDGEDGIDDDSRSQRSEPFLLDANPLDQEIEGEGEQDNPNDISVPEIDASDERFDEDASEWDESDRSRSMGDDSENFSAQDSFETEGEDHSESSPVALEGDDVKFDGESSLGAVLANAASEQVGENFECSGGSLNDEGLLSPPGPNDTLPGNETYSAPVRSFLPGSPVKHSADLEGSDEDSVVFSPKRFAQSPQKGDSEAKVLSPPTSDDGADSAQIVSSELAIDDEKVNEFEEDFADPVERQKENSANTGSSEFPEQSFDEAFGGFDDKISQSDGQFNGQDKFGAFDDTTADQVFPTTHENEEREHNLSDPGHDPLFPSPFSQNEAEGEDSEFVVKDSDNPAQQATNADNTFTGGENVDFSSDNEEEEEEDAQLFDGSESEEVSEPSFGSEVDRLESDIHGDSFVYGPGHGMEKPPEDVPSLGKSNDLTNLDPGIENEVRVMRKADGEDEGSDGDGWSQDSARDDSADFLSEDRLAVAKGLLDDFGVEPVEKLSPDEEDDSQNSTDLSNGGGASSHLALAKELLNFDSDSDGPVTGEDGALSPNPITDAPLNGLTEDASSDGDDDSADVKAFFGERAESTEPDGEASSSESEGSGSDSDDDDDNGDGTYKLVVKEAPLLRLENVTAQTRSTIPTNKKKQQGAGSWGSWFGFGGKPSGPTQSAGPAPATSKVSAGPAVGKKDGNSASKVKTPSEVKPKGKVTAVSDSKPEKQKPAMSEKSKAVQAEKTTGRTPDSKKDPGQTKGRETESKTPGISLEKPPIRESEALSDAPTTTQKKLGKGPETTKKSEISAVTTTGPTLSVAGKETPEGKGKAPVSSQKESRSSDEAPSGNKKKNKKKSKSKKGALASHLDKRTRKVSRHGDEVSVGTMNLVKSDTEQPIVISKPVINAIDEDSLAEKEKRPWEGTLAAKPKTAPIICPHSPLVVDGLIPEHKVSIVEKVAQLPPTPFAGPGSSIDSAQVKRTPLEPMIEEEREYEESEVTESTNNEKGGQTETASEEDPVEDEKEADKDEEKVDPEEEKDELTALIHLTDLESKLAAETPKEEGFEDTWENVSCDASTALRFEVKQREKERAQEKKKIRKHKSKNEKKTKKTPRLRLFENETREERSVRSNNGRSSRLSREFLSAIHKIFDDESVFEEGDNSDAEDQKSEVPADTLQRAGSERSLFLNTDQSVVNGGDADEEGTAAEGKSHKSSSRLSKKSGKSGSQTDSVRSGRMSRSSGRRYDDASVSRSGKNGRHKHSSRKSRQLDVDPALIFEAELKRQQGGKVLSIASLKQEMLERRGTSIQMLEREFKERKRLKPAGLGHESSMRSLGHSSRLNGSQQHFHSSQRSDFLDEKNAITRQTHVQNVGLSSHLSRWDTSESYSELDDLKTIIYQSPKKETNNLMEAASGMTSNIASHLPTLPEMEDLHMPEVHLPNLPRNILSQPPATPMRSPRRRVPQSPAPTSPMSVGGSVMVSPVRSSPIANAMVSPTLNHPGTNMMASPTPSRGAASLLASPVASGHSSHSGGQADDFQFDAAFGDMPAMPNAPAKGNKGAKNESNDDMFMFGSSKAWDDDDDDGGVGVPPQTSITEKKSPRFKVPGLGRLKKGMPKIPGRSGNASQELKGNGADERGLLG